MIHLPFASGKTYGVLGLGKSGRATVASLLASGAAVVAWDDGEGGRTAAVKEFPHLIIKPIAEWDFSTFAALIMSPGIFLTHPAVVAANKSGVEVIGDIELLYRAQPNAKYIGITGTNGKSTTTTLIAHILKACGKRVEVGGNLGTPALALAPLGDDGIYVLELSSYQLDLVNSTRFNVALLLNISPDHLDHHGSMENYIAAKMHIFDRFDEDDVAIVGVDDNYSEEISRKLIQIAERADAITVSTVKRTGGVDVLNGMLHSHLRKYPVPWPAKVALALLPLFLLMVFFPSISPNEDIRGAIGLLIFGLMLYGEYSSRFRATFDAVSIADIKSLQGAHNHQNAAAAYAACVACCCAHEEVIRAMQTYPGLAHRMEWLGEIDGVQYVNDSKATNADAAEKALLTYDNIYWIIGGVAKEGGIEPLANYFPKIRHAYLIGEAAESFAKTLEGKVAYTQCGTLEKAFFAAQYAAQQNRQKKPVVLLSPACASFDQYPNFEVRGKAFMQLVETLQTGEQHDTPAA